MQAQILGSRLSHFGKELFIYISHGVCILIIITSHVGVEKKNSSFHLDVTHIERCAFHVAWVILKKTRQEHQLKMHENAKQHVIDCSQASYDICFKKKKVGK